MKKTQNFPTDFLLENMTDGHFTHNQFCGNGPVISMVLVGWSFDHTCICNLCEKSREIENQERNA